MDDPARGILGESGATSEEIRQAWERASLAAMEDHREAGVSVAIWDQGDGVVRLVSAGDYPRHDRDVFVGHAGPGRQA